MKTKAVKDFRHIVNGINFEVYFTRHNRNVVHIHKHTTGYKYVSLSRDGRVINTPPG